MTGFGEIAAALESASWQVAKTMPDNPHEYTLRKNWRFGACGGATFDEAVMFIRGSLGYREKYKGVWYKCLDVNGFKYWTMGAPLAATILINRARIEKPAAYDAIAEGYDKFWMTPEAHRENQRIIHEVGYRGGSVLDIGCGTGLFLDYVYGPDEYLGIDPSWKMLHQLLKKHPGTHVLQTTFEAFWPGSRKFDLIVGLFAAPSYIDPRFLAGRLPALLEPGGRYFLMFYAPGYEPVTHKTNGIDIPFFKWTPGIVKGVKELQGNFVIVQGGASTDGPRA